MSFCLNTTPPPPPRSCAFWVPTGFLLDPYWVSIGSLLGSYWVPIGSLLDSLMAPYWVPIGSLLGSYLIPTGSDNTDPLPRRSQHMITRLAGVHASHRASETLPFALTHLNTAPGPHGMPPRREPLLPREPGRGENFGLSET